MGPGPKSITINCENAIAANTPAGGGTYTFIIVNAAATDIITLRGLDFDGHGESCGGTCGLIQFTRAAALHLDRLKLNKARTNARLTRSPPTGAAHLIGSDS